MRVHDEFESPKKLPPPRAILCDLAGDPSRKGSDACTPENIATPNGPKSVATSEDDDENAGFIFGGAKKLQRTSVKKNNQSINLKMCN